MDYDVFISYRRSDSTERAQLIREYLTANFNPNRIFLDTHEIHEGPFPDYIANALATTKYFVLVISRNSFSSNQSDQTDYYYEEIKRAVANNLIIIPVLYDGMEISQLDFPQDIDSLKLQNAITAHPDDPNGLKNRLLDFTKKPNPRHLKEWLAFPLAVISIYLLVSLISGIGMYVYDRYFTSYDDAVEIAAEHISSRDGNFYYPIDKNHLMAFNPETKAIQSIPMATSNGLPILIDENSTLKVGFWSTATALMYQIMKSKYKPHNGKQYLAYIGAAVGIVAGVGLGCTVERMIFPPFQTYEIKRNINNSSFWQDVIKRKYQSPNSGLYSI